VCSSDLRVFQSVGFGKTSEPLQIAVGARVQLDVPNFCQRNRMLLAWPSRADDAEF